MSFEIEETTRIIKLSSFYAEKVNYFKIGMIRKEVIEIQDIFPKIPTLIERVFFYGDEGAWSISNNSGSSWNIID